MNELAGLLSRATAALRAMFRSHQQTVVVCPRDRMPAAVALGAEEQLLDCSRQQGRSSCPESCIPQLQYSSDDLETFLRRTAGQVCSRCGGPVGAEDWYASRTAPAGESSRSAAALTATTAAPTCFTCSGHVPAPNL